MRLALLVMLALAAPAHAHDIRPGILSFKEDASGVMRMSFVYPVDNRGEAIELAIVLPDGCTLEKRVSVHCRDGFGGELAVGGMRGHAMKIYVSLERDGKRRDWVLTSESPRVDLGPAPSLFDRIGLDALALLVALLLALGLSQRFAVAAGAFLAAEALAGFLGHAAFGAWAAASVLLVVREATHDRESALRRWPWLAGALFGAVHGLVYAPAPRFLLAQLVAILVIAALVAGGRQLIGERRIVGLRAHRAACYALGALAAWQLLARVCG
jgi:hypothetical protein